MSYPPYGSPPTFPGSAPYGYPSAPTAPSYPGAPGHSPYPTPGAYPAHGSPPPPAPAHGSPPLGGHGYQPSYGGGYPGVQGQQSPYGGYPNQPSPPTGYPSTYGQPYAQPGYGHSSPPPPTHPQQPHGGYSGYPTYPSAPGGYPAGYPSTPSHQQPYQQQQQQQHGYGAAPAAAHGGAPGYGVPSEPVVFTFAQKGFDRSGTIKDASGKVLYKLKDESDKHTWTKYVKSRPLMVTRGDGTKLGLFHWKDSPKEAKIEAFAIWGNDVKLKLNGEILDTNWKFKLPRGGYYEWDGPHDTEGGIFKILDHQQVNGQGFDRKPKSIAQYTPHGDNTDATLAVLPEALHVPDLVDVLIMTSFFFEYTLDSARQSNNWSDLGKAIADGLAE